MFQGLSLSLIDDGVWRTATGCGLPQVSDAVVIRSSQGTDDSSHLERKVAHLVAQRTGAQDAEPVRVASVTQAHGGAYRSTAYHARFAGKQTTVGRSNRCSVKREFSADRTTIASAKSPKRLPRIRPRLLLHLNQKRCMWWNGFALTTSLSCTPLESYAYDSRKELGGGEPSARVERAEAEWMRSRTISGKSIYSVCYGASTCLRRKPYTRLAIGRRILVIERRTLCAGVNSLTVNDDLQHHLRVSLASKIFDETGIW